MDIGEWLRGLGFEQYQAAFRENEIDGEVLPTLTAEDLKELGVTILALLWQIWFNGVCEELLTMRATHWRRSCDQVEDGLPDGGHGRLRRWASDSFFPLPPP